MDIDGKLNTGKGKVPIKDPMKTDFNTSPNKNIA